MKSRNQEVKKLSDEQKQLNNELNTEKNATKRELSNCQNVMLPETSKFGVFRGKKILLYKVVLFFQILAPERVRGGLEFYPRMTMIVLKYPKQLSKLRAEDFFFYF